MNDPMQKMLANVLQELGEKMPTPEEVQEMEKKLKRKMLIYKFVGAYVIITSALAHGVLVGYLCGFLIF